MKLLKTIFLSIGSTLIIFGVYFLTKAGITQKKIDTFKET